MLNLQCTCGNQDRLSLSVLYNGDWVKIGEKYNPKDMEMIRIDCDAVACHQSTVKHYRRDEA